ncbi:hypothetical protein SAMN05216344_11239 [Polaromonas sp. OV174]|uniref:hypothetical protein n=1 Tax=Polaromonas sp. OV174 TaxID=1855300 RepID=UPI0008F144B5|nr:hypothetical protein [Polaromonas sp. OV174]SFC24475.1 hypothetical protein SAMN05216344_11239 [Polaromonas sp. OV174]
MRIVFSVLSLLLVLAVVGVLAKKQLAVAPVRLPPAQASSTPQVQSQQIQQQFQQTLEKTLQQARPMPEGE